MENCRGRRHSEKDNTEMGAQRGRMGEGHAHGHRQAGCCPGSPSRCVPEQLAPSLRPCFLRLWSSLPSLKFSVFRDRVTSHGELKNCPEVIRNAPRKAGATVLKDRWHGHLHPRVSKDKPPPSLRVHPNPLVLYLNCLPDHPTL